MLPGSGDGAGLLLKAASQFIDDHVQPSSYFKVIKDPACMAGLLLIFLKLGLFYFECTHV